MFQLVCRNEFGPCQKVEGLPEVRRDCNISTTDGKGSITRPLVRQYYGAGLGKSWK